MENTSLPWYLIEFNQSGKAYDLMDLDNMFWGDDLLEDEYGNENRGWMRIDVLMTEKGKDEWEDRREVRSQLMKLESELSSAQQKEYKRYFKDGDHMFCTSSPLGGIICKSTKNAGDKSVHQEARLKYLKELNL